MNTKIRLSRNIFRFTAVSVVLAIMSESALAAAEYTLYRSGIDVMAHAQDEKMRIHIATFDAKPHSNDIENDKYNRANCDFAQAFFTDNQPHFRGSSFNDIKIRYWCEKGLYRK